MPVLWPSTSNSATSRYADFTQHGRNPHQQRMRLHEKTPIHNFNMRTRFVDIFKRVHGASELPRAHARALAAVGDSMPRTAAAPRTPRDRIYHAGHDRGVAQVREHVRALRHRARADLGSRRDAMLRLLGHLPAMLLPCLVADTSEPCCRTMSLPYGNHVADMPLPCCWALSQQVEGRVAQERPKGPDGRSQARGQGWRLCLRLRTMSAPLAPEWAVGAASADVSPSWADLARLWAGYFGPESAQSNAQSFCRSLPTLVDFRVYFRNAFATRTNTCMATFSSNGATGDARAPAYAAR